VTGYGGRLRTLEGRFGGGQCPLCSGYPAIAFVTVHGDETPPPAPPPCAACGKLATRFIVHHAAEPIDTQQPEPPARDNNARAETAPNARTRRRQWYG